jgi:anti-sigma regulatory factor (Ser/Thr protein kinase)
MASATEVAPDVTARDRFDPARQIAIEQTRLVLPSRLEWIEPTTDFLAERAKTTGLDARRAHRLVLCLHEALTNSVVHGNLEISSDLKEEGGEAFAEALAIRSSDPEYAERRVTIDFIYAESGWTIRIADEGPGFDHDRLEAKVRLMIENPEDYLDDSACSGRGLLMMMTMLDGCHYDQGGRRVNLTLLCGPSSDGRAAERMDCLKPSRMIPVRDDGSVDWDKAAGSVAIDISEGGVGLLQPEGRSFRRMLVEVEHEGRPTYLPAEVCHVTPREGGMVQIGCRFLFTATDRKSPATVERSSGLDALLDALRENQLPHDDRRSHRRVRFSEPVDAILQDQDSRVVFARDLSRGGIAFIATFEAEKGPIEVAIRKPDGSGSLRMRGRVVRCTKLTEGIFDVGVKFED